VFSKNGWPPVAATLAEMVHHFARPSARALESAARRGGDWRAAVVNHYPASLVDQLYFW
jgi:hypothetical protein